MNKRHALGAALPHGVLAASERPVGALLRAAIVRHEDHHGVPVLVDPPQRQGHVHHGLVQGGDHALPPGRLLQLPIRLIQPGVLVWDLRLMSVLLGLSRIMCLMMQT